MSATHLHRIAKTPERFLYNFEDNPVLKPELFLVRHPHSDLTQSPSRSSDQGLPIQTDDAGSTVCLQTCLAVGRAVGCWLSADLLAFTKRSFCRHMFSDCCLSLGIMLFDIFNGLFEINCGNSFPGGLRRGSSSLIDIDRVQRL